MPGDYTKIPSAFDEFRRCQARQEQAMDDAERLERFRVWDVQPPLADARKTELTPDGLRQQAQAFEAEIRARFDARYL